MRTKYLFLNCLFLTFALFLPNALAQDYSQWDLPEGATARLGKGSITDIAYSVDGSRLAVAGSIGVWLYDARTGKELALLTGHTSYVNSVSFSPDGNTLASGGRDSTIRLWDVSTGRHLQTLTGHTSYVNSVSFSPDGNTLASGGRDKIIRLWDPHTGKHKQTPTGHLGWVRSVSFSPDGNTIASGNDRGICLWDAHTGRHQQTLEGYTDFVVRNVSFSPDSKTMVSVDASLHRGATVRLWDVNTGVNLRILTESPVSVAFSPGGETLASGSEDGTIRLWDVNAWTHLRTLTGHTRHVSSVVFSPGGETLASGSEDGTIRLWDVNTWTHLRTLTGHTFDVSSVAFSPDGNTIASKDFRNIDLWDAHTGRHQQTLEGSVSGNSVSFSPDGNTIASGGYLWDAHTGRLKGVTGGGNSVVFSPDGTTLACFWGGFAGGETIDLWDARTGRPQQTLKGHTDDVNSVSFSPDGKTLASGSEDGTIRVWDARTGRHQQTLKEHHMIHIFSVSFSPDGNTLASGGFRNIVLWDAHTGRHQQTLTGHTSKVLSVSFSPDGNMIASGGGFDGTLRVWDARTGRHQQTLKGHAAGSVLNSVAFSPDGNTIASGSSDGTILLWDVSPVPATGGKLTPVPTAPQTPQKIAETALVSTVLIVMEDSNGQPLGSGSGFFVGDSMIATNLHVVKKGFGGYVKRVGVNTKFPITKIIATDAQQDLAIVEVSNVKGPSLSLGDSDLVKIGDPVYAVGNPAGFLEGTFTEGNVSGVREFRIGSKRIQISAPISEGSSGGPVLNNKAEVIGVAVSTLRRGQNLNFAVPSNYLSELLNKVRGRK